MSTRASTFSSLNQRDDLDLIEEYERRESGEHVLLEDGGRGQDDVLDVLHAVRLVDLGEELGVVDLDDLVDIHSYMTSALCGEGSKQKETIVLIGGVIVTVTWG